MRRASALGAAFAAFASVSLGWAPSAAAEDVQAKQWYLASMQADQMWKVSTGDGVKVAVLDTGVAETPSLKGQILVNEVPKSVSYHATEDYGGHGTTIAELIAGTGSGGGLKGLAPGAKIVPYRVRLVGLKGSEEQKTPEVDQAIRAAADTDAKIINMSFGGYVSVKQEAAINYAVSKGKLLIASVGNEGEEGEGSVGYPAGYPYVVGVSAVDASGTVTKFSSYGNNVDLAAPGLDIPYWCDKTLRSYCDAGEGTSQASAIASASAALVWSAHPDWTANQVLRSLIDTAGRTWKKDIPSKYLGYGIVRPRKVLEDSGYNPGPADSDPLGKANAAGGATPSPSGSVPAPSQAPETPSGGETVAAESTSKSSDDSSTLWIGLGAVAAVVVIGGGAFAVKRARSRA
ncbi:S8 family serine peptidase [Streptomyces nodosus]|uniref:S8 family serine peptidase n=1 Tax=Streptomyces nodosus TaxID=40318 RepID=UPI0034534D2F